MCPLIHINALERSFIFISFVALYRLVEQNFITLSHLNAVAVKDMPEEYICVALNHQAQFNKVNIAGWKKCYQQFNASFLENYVVDPSDLPTVDHDENTVSRNMPEGVFSSYLVHAIDQFEASNRPDFDEVKRVFDLQRYGFAARIGHGSSEPTLAQVYPFLIPISI